MFNNLVSSKKLIHIKKIWDVTKIENANQIPQTKEKSAEIQKDMRHCKDDNEFPMFTLSMQKKPLTLHYKKTTSTLGITMDVYNV